MSRKPKEYQRSAEALYIAAGARCPPIAHALYRVFMDDGSSRYERGRTLRTMHGTQDLNGSKKEIAMHAISLRTEMHTEVSAAALLYQHIMAECQYIDEQYAKLAKRSK